MARRLRRRRPPPGVCEVSAAGVQATSRWLAVARSAGCRVTGNPLRRGRRRLRSQGWGGLRCARPGSGPLVTGWRVSDNSGNGVWLVGLLERGRKCGRRVTAGIGFGMAEGTLGLVEAVALFADEPPDDRAIDMAVDGHVPKGPSSLTVATSCSTKSPSTVPPSWADGSACDLALRRRHSMASIRLTAEGRPQHPLLPLMESLGSGTARGREPGEEGGHGRFDR